jgi:hypothetical protein
MFERKPILLGIFAILVGITTILPLEYLMSPHIAQAASAPWFNVNVFYAYCNPNQNGGNSSVSFYGSYIQAVVNITLTPYAMKDADAQIEYYQFAVSSDQGPIVNVTYYVVQSTQDAITSISGTGTISFANGLTYSGHPSNGGQVINRDVSNNSFTLASVDDYIFTIDPNDVPQAVTELRNAQTLYMDMSNVCTVTVNGNVTVTTPANPEILQHITLTKTGSIFVYGTNTE